ncbi:MAG: hypothetical protein D6691_07025 [Candidatus Hydrogenedentota bacterium]|uniref:Uncharacterized protein n=1 Tax=Sumerlaea chitinivorans TaxID=2250252 RepID=A0A2Z4Y7F8_SUMC1|nr:hypothetical protein BRCON_2407 [Candidatus Sumerlaea chitinivorans]RMH27051.1 MAG: hypothetical protein D6691_07025 [Candidatus Hydrogenedentota bacterium]
MEKPYLPKEQATACEEKDLVPVCGSRKGVPRMSSHRTLVPLQSLIYPCTRFVSNFFIARAVRLRIQSRP